VPGASASTAMGHRRARRVSGARSAEEWRTSQVRTRYAGQRNWSDERGSGNEAGLLGLTACTRGFARTSEGYPTETIR
jgi:hypothetical protein